jgi:hypothetical protein
VIHSLSMKRAAAWLLLLVLPALAAPPAARALDPKQVETDWKWDVYFASFSGVTSQTVDPGGFGSVGYSSTNANVVARSYAVYAQGASAQWRVAHTTRTFSLAVSPYPTTTQVPSGWAAGSAAAASISTSPRVGIPPGVLYNGDFWTLTSNPVFYFDSLSTAATYWFWTELGRPKNSR